MRLPTLIIVSPALQAGSGVTNGNSQTAMRWARMLRGLAHVHLVLSDQAVQHPAWQTAHGLVALHARRSAPAIAAWQHEHPSRPLVCVLTGTDLYRDIAHDASAQASLAGATALWVLQDEGVAQLPTHLHAKTRVIYQSTRRWQPVEKRLPQPAGPAQCAVTLKAVMVGHLRDEKDPLTYLRAAQHLSPLEGISLTHIGSPLDAALAAAAQQAALSLPHYRYLGGLPHAAARRSMARAHVMVIASRMEGGANVILEAIQSATPVLASRISGNVGMLGAQYAGYFELGDERGLATLLRRCRDDAAFLALLQQQCAVRAPRFEPQTERRTLAELLQPILTNPQTPLRTR